MISTHARFIAGLLAAMFGAVAAPAFVACGTDEFDCRNTRTCIPPPCMDGGVLDAGDCCKADDGGFVCAP
jgi:hypothetical protein